LGENILLHFCLENQSNESFTFYIGGDYRGGTRSNRFKVSVKDKDGNIMLDPDPGFNLGGIGTSPVLKSGERWCQLLTLIRYARIDNADANRMMDMLRRLARETGSAALLVHHCSKSDKKGGIYSGRGASAIGGAVDVVVNMEALDPESIKLKVDKNRISGDYMTLFIRKTGERTFLLRKSL